VGSFNAVALGRSPVGWPRPANTGGRGFLAGYRFRLLNSLEVGYWNGDNRITRGQRPALSQCHARDRQTSLPRASGRTGCPSGRSLRRIGTPPPHEPSNAHKPLARLGQGATQAGSIVTASSWLLRSLRLRSTPRARRIAQVGQPPRALRLREFAGACQSRPQ
jgi:hypothetical protein